jgi:peptidoglycan hydrolase-like protein with peptidoglycan-binding domain
MPQCAGRPTRCARADLAFRAPQDARAHAAGGARTGPALATARAAPRRSSTALVSRARGLRLPGARPTRARLRRVRSVVTEDVARTHPRDRGSARWRTGAHRRRGPHAPAQADRAAVRACDAVTRSSGFRSTWSPSRPTSPVDGVLGASTQQALMGLQTSRGLPASGETDPATWQAVLALPVQPADWVSRGSGARAAAAAGGRAPAAQRR